ncbi:alpha/beta hydrolase [Bacillus sp. ISL-18]|uniref:alpha/beta hydrolase n=1 Tax=Bacillus sp. ISL-18 TaxID=2819118 RepID=UPI001BE833CB|nr:alpha/beta hydrolase [Bacillus sp. ISL-18]MBT2654580.1 alpha/beta hydrolase [Bacillus sp. ISL-18]
MASLKGFKKTGLVLAGALLVTATAFHSSDQAKADSNIKDKYPDSEISQTEIQLWTGDAPGYNGVQLTQKITERSKDPQIHDRAITGVLNPSIIPFFPSKGKSNGAAVLVMPGGAYDHLTFDKEGYDVAQWLNSVGVTAFVLKNRLPAEGWRNGYNVPLEDAQRAIRMIRGNADQWGIDPTKVGVAGFSAGGHLATTLGEKYSAQVYSPVDSADQLSARPDFMILGYPVASMQDGITNVPSRQKLLGSTPSQDLIDQFSSELHVNANTPPTFIVQASNDTSAPTQATTAFYNALKQAKVETEMHEFRTGGHGFGIRSASGALELWTVLADEWLAAKGYIPNLSAEDIIPTVQDSIKDLRNQ